MSSDAQPCPIWESAPKVQDISEVGCFPTSNRAGGRFVLKQDGAALFQPRTLTPRRRANLSYWIYKHNLDNGVFDDRGGKPLVVDQAWVECHRDWPPSAEDRMLTLLRELIRSDDAGKEPSGDLLMAAGGCRDDKDLGELIRHAMKEGWTGSLDPNLPSPRTDTINLAGRLHVEERTRERGENQQAVVPDPAKNESEFTISTNIQKLPIEEDVVPIIEERLDEARRAMGAGAHLSVIFLCGSVLEGVLLGAAGKDPEKFNKAKAAGGSPKHFREWGLARLIDVACEIEILTPDVQKLSHGLRDFRNYIHPQEQMKSGFTPTRNTAKLCFQVLETALASLAGER